MTNRITRPQMFMEIAGVIAKRSTCFRANVGAIITHQNNIVAIGYNGPAAGEAHCAGHLCEGALTGCQRALHAEVNAIERITRGVDGPLDMYCTHSPCVVCSEKISITPGIERFFFRDLYRVNDHLHLLIVRGIGLYQVTPAGYIVDYLIQRLIDVEAL